MACGTGRHLEHFARELQCAGVVEPWFQPEQWLEGHLSLVSVDRPDLKVARMSVSGRRGEVAVFDAHHLVGTAADIDTFVERHELALFRWADYRAAFERAGLVPEVDEHGLTGRGLVVAVAGDSEGRPG